MQHSKELNEIQDAVLDGISIVRDSIADAIDRHMESSHKFRKTIQRHVSYQSERSQCVSYLVSSNMIWDAEMILRSFFEANLKIWYLCSLRGPDQEEAVDEFLGAFLDVQSHKRGVKAGLARPIAENLKQDFDVKIFAALESSENFQFHDGNKKERREIEQRWSFSYLIRQLEITPKKILDFSSIRALEHGFGMQSHLLHADISALDLMLDRMTRDPDELEALVGTHVCRIFSDQICVWAMTSIAIWSCVKPKDPRAKEVVKSVENVLKLRQPFSDRFETSQQGLYESPGDHKT